MVNFFGKDIGFKDDLKKALQENVSQEMAQHGIDWMTPRPSMDQYILTKETGAKVPIYPFPMYQLYDIAKRQDSIRVPLEILRRELFRNGLEIVEKFKYKCTNCGKEFQSKPEDADTADTRCDTCGETLLVRPAPEHRKYLERLLTDAINENGQSLYDVLYEIEWDLDVTDNACMVLLKTYYVDGVSKKILNKEPAFNDKDFAKNIARDTSEEGEDDDDEDDEEDNSRGFDVKKKESDTSKNADDLKDSASVSKYEDHTDGALLNPKEPVITTDTDHDPSNIIEIMRIAPSQVILIADAQGRIGYRDSGSATSGAIQGSGTYGSMQVYVCPFHRNKLQDENICEDCGSECLTAVAEVSNTYTAVFNNGSGYTDGIYYGAGEIIFGSKYMPSILYGYSPMYALYTKIMTLAYMDQYLMHYFDKMRPPKGLLFVSTRNFESLYKTWKTILDKVKENPHEIHPIAVENDKGGKQAAQFIDLMRSLEEMEFVEARNEFRRIIAIMYGISPIFGGEVKGGITNESLQVTISNRAMEFGHATLHQRFLNKLTKMLGISDWIIRFKPAEVIDKLRELEIKGQEITNAEAMARMGYAHKLSHTGEFIFSKEPVNQQAMLEAKQNNGFGNNEGGDGGDGKSGLSDKKANAPKEKQTNFDGQPEKRRPSDKGGVGQGSHASGTGTTLSNKAEKPYKQRSQKIRWVHK